MDDCIKLKSSIIKTIMGGFPFSCPELETKAQLLWVGHITYAQWRFAEILKTVQWGDWPFKPQMMSAVHPHWEKPMGMKCWIKMRGTHFSNLKFPQNSWFEHSELNLNSLAFKLAYTVLIGRKETFKKSLNKVKSLIGHELALKEYYNDIKLKWARNLWKSLSLNKTWL